MCFANSLYLLKLSIYKGFNDMNTELRPYCWDGKG